MSVAIGDPLNLPAHRRPAAHGGYGPDPVWVIDSSDLPASLAFRPDPDDPSRHGFVEPIETMRFEEYQEMLASTRGVWSQT